MLYILSIFCLLIKKVRRRRFACDGEGLPLRRSGRAKPNYAPRRVALCHIRRRATLLNLHSVNLVS
jgi:hypothetical protein